MTMEMRLNHRVIIIILLSLFGLIFSPFAYAIPSTGIEITKVDETRSEFTYQGFVFGLVCDSSIGNKGVVDVYFSSQLGEDYRYKDMAVEDKVTPISYKSVLDKNSYTYKWIFNVNVADIIDSYNQPHRAFGKTSNKLFYMLMNATRDVPVELNVGGVTSAVYFKGTGLHKVIMDCSTLTKNFKLEHYYEIKDKDYDSELAKENLRATEIMKKSFNSYPLDLDVDNLVTLTITLEKTPSKNAWVNLKDTSLFRVKRFYEDSGVYLVVHESEYDTEQVNRHAFLLKTSETYVRGDYIGRGYYIYEGTISGFYDRDKGIIRAKLPRISFIKTSL